jgi:UDP-glucose 4-epimerase
MKIFITGAKGFIGGHLVRSLLASGHQVSGYDNDRRPEVDRSDELSQHPNWTSYHGDIRAYDHLMHHARGHEAIVHLAAQANVIGAADDPDYTFATNVIGSYNVFKAASSCGIGKLVFISSREVYGEVKQLPVAEDAPLRAKNNYGVSKIAGEAYARLAAEKAPFHLFILRLANVYGYGDSGRVIPIFLNNLQRGEAFKIYGGKQVIDFIHVDAVVEAISKCLGRDVPLPGPVNIGSGQGSTLQELAESIQPGCQPQIYPSRELETMRYTADVTKAAELLEWHPPPDRLYGLSDIIGNYMSDAAVANGTPKS